eukprot:CAMPEP_0118894052 /NCGR_PEP_ID=MMETSP1166-20130328/3002_1 /TAXON_ID=1104430 /ORGANISM="Chrysoreinhardia sp, Strain CCMP3193" /LENGTH=152 /DNA_ID=CAMNT_0006832929 /DNA_START=100 /DNA_END=558 /DNA_ORIENTATION=+
MVAGEPIDEENVFILFGLCCCNLGFQCTDCLGVATENTLLCVDHMCCLKLGAEPIWCACSGNDRTCCRLGLGVCGVGLVRPTACCKGQGQICCLVQSCAFPTDREIPTTLAFMGLTCAPYCGCCPRLNAVRQHQNTHGGGAPTAPESLTIER